MAPGVMLVVITVRFVTMVVFDMVRDGSMGVLGGRYGVSDEMHQPY